MDNSSDRFQYNESLDGSSIRLIQVLPSISPGHLEISLSKHDIQEGKYEALSYAWGENLWNVYIKCNKGTMEISFNLYQALCERQRRGSTMPLWADAICIDQNNLEEKSQQVQLMGDIYRNADRVVVWLGCQGACEQNSLQFVQLAKALYEESDGPNFDIDLPLRDQPCLRLRRGNAVEELRKARHTLVDVSSSRWFTRKWVVQELILAKRAVMWIDKQEIAAEIVLWLMVRLFVQDAALRFQVLESTHLSIKILLAPFYFRYKSQPTKAMSIATALGRLRGMDTTEPHDQIFAIAAIVSDFPLDYIDYTQSFAVIASKTGRYILERALTVFPDAMHATNGSQSSLLINVDKIVDLEPLESLARAPNPQNHRLGLPSWIPDLFSAHFGIEAPYGGHRLLGLCSMFPICDYNALDVGLPEMRWEVKSREMSSSMWSSSMEIKGKAISRISTVHPHSGIRSWAIIDHISSDLAIDVCNRSMETRKDMIDVCLENLAYITRLRLSADSSLEIHDDIMSSETFDEFWRTLVYDNGYAEPGIGFSFCYWFMLLKVLVKYLEEGAIFTSLICKIQALINLARPFCTKASNCGSTRTFIVSDQGRLGWAPFLAQPNDWIVVFAGMRIPSILRLVEGDYQFLGCCFLYGMMDGEWNDPARTWQLFKLV